MPRRHVVLALASGCLIGTAGGLIGLGGAEFRIPVLVGLMGWRPKAAVSLNLTISMAVLLAALPARAASVSWDSIGPHAPELCGMIAGSVCAAVLGAGWLARMPDAAVARVLPILLGVLGAVMIGDAFLGAGVHVFPAEPVAAALSGAACGIVIGLVSSMLGVAGGELIIPAFVLGFGAPMKLGGTLSMLVGLPTIAAGLMRHVRAPTSPLRDAAVWRGTIAPFVVGSVAGAVLGGLLLGLVPSSTLKIALGLILIWSASQTFRHLKRPAV